MTLPPSVIRWSSASSPPCNGSEENRIWTSGLRKQSRHVYASHRFQRYVRSLAFAHGRFILLVTLTRANGLTKHGHAGLQSQEDVPLVDADKKAKRTWFKLRHRYRNESSTLRQPSEIVAGSATRHDNIKRATRSEQQSICLSLGVVRFQPRQFAEP